MWARPLDRTELHYVGMRNFHMRHGREWGMLSAILQLETALTTESFVDGSKVAWKWIRYRHPTVASKLSDDETQRIYNVADTQELDAWLAETFVLHDSTALAQQVRLDLKPVNRVTLHVFPHSEELLLQTPHHLMDGHSLLRLMDCILELLATPPALNAEFGDEAQYLAPAPRVAANFPTATPEQLSKCQSEINDWISGMPSVGVGASHVRDAPGNTKVQRMTLDEHTTTAIIAAAKARGLTPTHVVEAAVIISARELEKRLRNMREDRNYCSCGLFSLRSWCSSSRAQDATLPYVTFLPQVIKPGSFAETAAQVKGYYAGWKTHHEDLLAVIEPTLQAFASMSSSGASEPNQMISVSSFGRFEPRLESVHGSVKVKDFLFVYETPDPGISSFSWTRQGRLSWVVCYNEVYHEDETIAEWVKMTQSTLLAGLGVAGQE